MFFEQYDHEPTIAVVPVLAHLLGTPDRLAARIADCRRRRYRALEAMERHLATHTFLVAERFTIADISLYAYTHVAREGGFDLERLPGGRAAWLERVAAQPGHVPITA